MKCLPELPRVCIVSDLFPPRYSGVGQQAFEIGRNLAQLGHQVTVLTSCSGSPVHERVSGMDVRRVLRIRSEKLGLLTYSASIALELLIHRQKYDIVHFFHGEKSIFLPLLLLLCLGKRSFVTSSMLGTDDLQSIAQAKFGKLRVRLLALRSTYVGQSLPISARCQMVRNGPRVVEIPYGVDINRFKPVSKQQRLEMRRVLGIPEQSFVAAFVGAVGPRKGADIAIKAWQQVVSRIPEALLLLIGPRKRILEVGPDPEQAAFADWLDEFIGAAGMQQQVRFLQTTEVHRYLQVSDLFILPSSREGLPNAVLEAMSCGLPIIIGKADWTCDNGLPGIIIDRNPDLLYQSTVDLYNNPGYRVELGEAARKVALEKYSLPVQASKYSKLYSGTKVAGF